MIRPASIAVAVLLLGISALAQRAGEVGKLLPAGFITRAKATSEAKAADPVWLNDVVRTNERGRMRITLDDGSILTLGTKSELRIIRHDRQTQQSTVELLYGRVRSRVAAITKAGASYNVRTPTAVIGVIGTDFLVETRMASTATNVSSDVVSQLPSSTSFASLAELQPGAAPGGGVSPTIADFAPVDATLVYAYDGVTAVRNIEVNIVDLVYLLPGEAALVERGKPPVKFRWDEDRQDPENKDPLQRADLSPFENCPGPIDLTRPRSGAQVPEYRIVGRGTSTGEAFDVEIRNPNPECPLDVFIPHGAVLKPKGFLKRVVVGILLGGGPPLKDFQVMMTEGAAEELPAPSAVPAAGMHFVSEDGKDLKFTLRGYCLELHKLPPRGNTEYRFDQEKTAELGHHRKIIEASHRLYYSGKTRSPMHPRDAITQWALWSRIEKHNQKEFMKEYMKLVEMNYKAQKKKWDKKAKQTVEASAKDLWQQVEKVLADVPAK